MRCLTFYSALNTEVSVRQGDRLSATLTLLNDNYQTNLKMAYIRSYNIYKGALLIMHLYFYNLGGGGGSQYSLVKLEKIPLCQ